MSRVYEHYRMCTLGQSLSDALDEMVRGQELSEDLAHQVMTQYDKSICEALAQKIRTRATIKVRREKGCFLIFLGFTEKLSQCG